jgi:predicted ArsR family transcriptional regulator
MAEKMSEKLSVKTRVKVRVKTREKILSVLKATPYITVNEMAEIVGISSKGVE